MIPRRVTKLRDIGRDCHLHNQNGALKTTSICTKLLIFLLDLHSDEDVQLYLRSNKKTFLELIRSAVFHEIERNPQNR